MGRLIKATTMVVTLALGLAVAVGCGNSGPAPAATVNAPPTPMGTLTVPTGATIELTEEGPVPATVTVKAGTPILFILQDETYGKSTVEFDDFQVGSMQWLLPGQSRVFSRLNDKAPGEYTYAMVTRPDKKGTIIIE